MRSSLFISACIGGSLFISSLVASNVPLKPVTKVSGSTPFGEETVSSEVITKNMARFHVGTILEKFDSQTRYYLPDPSAVAWLDEDDTTTCTLPTGKQFYLITLENPTLIQNFSIAAETLSGKISLYASDQKAMPGTKTWVPLIKGLSAQELKEKEYQKPLFSFTRYILLETELVQPAEVSSLYLFTDSDAASYKLVKRPQPSRFTEKAGPFYKDPKGQVNFAGRYARSKSGSEDDNLAKMTDESPESSGSLDQKPMVIDLKESRQIERLSIFAEKKRGMMNISLEEDRLAPSTPSTTYLPHSVQILAGIGWQKSGGMLAQLSGGVENKISSALTRNVVFDGSSDRFSVQLPATPCRFLTMTWASGETPTTPLKIKNFSAMGNISLNDYHVNRSLAITEVNSSVVNTENGTTDSVKTNEPNGQTTGSTTLGNLAISTEENLNLPPVVPVSN